jgi:hypothetical protein
MILSNKEKRRILRYLDFHAASKVNGGLKTEALKLGLSESMLLRLRDQLREELNAPVSNHDTDCKYACLRPPFERHFPCAQENCPFKRKGGAVSDEELA